jgi:hypothetical protein
MLAYGGQPQAIQKILAAMPEGDENQPLQIHYLYALRTIEDGWRLEDKTALAELLGRCPAGAAARSSSTSSGRCSIPSSRSLRPTRRRRCCSPRRRTSRRSRPSSSPRSGAAGGSWPRRPGRRRGVQSPLAARRAGAVISRQEMLEEAVFQPQQKLDRCGGPRGVPGQLRVLPPLRRSGHRPRRRRTEPHDPARPRRPSTRCSKP